MNANSYGHATSVKGFGNSWDTWAVTRRLDERRYPNHPFACSAQLPTTSELRRLGVDLFVLEHELSQGMSAELFTRALALGVFDVDAFNNGPRYRENAAEYYSALASVVDRFEERHARKARRSARLFRREVAAVNRALGYLSEAI